MKQRHSVGNGGPRRILLAASFGVGLLVFAAAAERAVAQGTTPATPAEAGWKSKEINRWTPEDARQILRDSPWAKTTKAIVSRLQTEDERRAGGNMGQAHGVGYDGVDPKGSDRSVMDGLRGRPDPRRTDQPFTLTVRWESALPVQAAEFRTGFVDPPTLRDDGYRIAVYDIPGGYLKGDPKSLGDPLKDGAYLRRAGKKDVKPSSVEVFTRDDGTAVVYLFPYSAELSRKDGQVEFGARIGRIGLAQAFRIEEMMFHGKLEL